MSNHSGSYMLNEVLLSLEEQGFFSKLGPQKTLEFVHTIMKIGFYHDCNPGEILEEIGERIGICYYCMKLAQDIEDGVCLSCRQDPA